MAEVELRTAEELRQGDVAELFPHRPLLVLQATSPAEHPGQRRLVVLDQQRVVSTQLVDAGTYYRLLERGLHGRAADYLARFR